jgi:hypothetical protein
MNDDDSDFDRELTPYQQAVGSILYLTQCTRPDIAYAVNNVSRYNNCFGKSHWIAVKRIMRYLKGTAHMKLAFRKQHGHRIYGYTDADWAADMDERKSCTGYVFIRSGCAITWNSRRQQTVALSTTEAEYMALSAASQEAIWLKQLEDEFFNSCKPVNIFCDNQSAIKLVENNGYSARSKHIDIRHHFVREKFVEKKISINYVNTEENVSDALTKPLAKAKFNFCRNLFGLI